MGIEKELIRAGTGPKPSPGQNVTVHCTGFARGERNIENVMKCFFDQEIVGDKELANYLRGKVSVVEDHIAKTNRLFYKMDGKRTCDTFKDRIFISVMPTLPIHLIEQPICLSNTLFNHGKNGDLTQKFWSTKDPGQQPFTFKIGQGQVIKGWDEGVLGMQLGEVARLRCSPDYAYGAGGFPAWGIQPNSTLIFEIEVLRAQ